MIRRQLAGNPSSADLNPSVAVDHFQPAIDHGLSKKGRRMAGIGQGTSAVNSEGKVLVFVLCTDWVNFRDFVIEGDVIRLLAADGADHARKYGCLTVDAVKRLGRLTAVGIAASGKATEAVELRARRGR